MHTMIVGATSWGCTLAILLDRAGSSVTVLCRSEAEAAELARFREHRRLLPGVILPESVHFQVDPVPAGAVIFAVPAQRMRQNLRDVLPRLDGPATIVSAAKGIEVSSRLRMSQVIAAELDTAGIAAPIVVLSGPNLAREIAAGEPATTVVASEDEAAAATLRGLLMTPAFRVYTNSDVLGVELGGALKNVIAIGVGIGDALNVGENGRASFLTRGLAEMARLGVALGANPLTFTGLACLGDLIATAASPRSRNRGVGVELGHGRSLDDVLAGMVHIAEGVDTTRAVHQIAHEAGVEMPITAALHAVLFDGLPPQQAIHQLMTRDAQDDVALG